MKPQDLRPKKGRFLNGRVSNGDEKPKRGVFNGQRPNARGGKTTGGAPRGISLPLGPEGSRSAGSGVAPHERRTLCGPGPTRDARRRETHRLGRPTGYLPLGSTIDR